MSTYRIAVMGVVLAMVGVACSSGPEAEPVEAPVEEPDEITMEMEEATDPELELPGVVVGPEWLEEHLMTPELVVIHVGQDREEWGEAHIPGQVFIPFEETVVGSFEEGFYVPPVDEVRQVFEGAGVSDESLVVLTGELDGLMATRALLTLEVLGLKGQAAILDGGLRQWREDGRPLGERAVEPEAGAITVSADDEFVLDAEAVMAMLEAEGVALIDLRPEEEYTGEVAGGGVERPGHIPGAINIFWKSTLQQMDRPLLLPTDEIEAIFEEAGVGDDDTLVVYCRTGMQASFGFFLGHLLERDVMIYDGSYVDWASDQGRPVVE